MLATNAWTGQLLGRPDWIWPIRGQILAASEFYCRMHETLGAERARDVLRFKVRSQEALEEFLHGRSLTEEVGWEKRGSYFLASSEPEEQELRRSCKLLTEDGFDVEWHDAKKVLDRIGGGSFSGGLHAPGDALVDPALLTHAIARCDGVALEKHGGGIAGSSIAFSLAERGIDTVLLERDSIASGASGRNDDQLLLEASELRPLKPVSVSGQCPSKIPTRISSEVPLPT